MILKQLLYRPNTHFGFIFVEKFFCEKKNEEVGF